VQWVKRKEKKKTNQRQLIIAWEKPFLLNQWQKQKQKRNKQTHRSLSRE
jgi:hypothetical protein